MMANAPPRNDAGRRRVESVQRLSRSSWRGCSYLMLARVVRIREVFRDPVGNRREALHQIALVNPVALRLELALGHSHEDDQRRVQAQISFSTFQLRNLTGAWKLDRPSPGSSSDPRPRRPRDGASARSSVRPCREAGVTVANIIEMNMPVISSARTRGCPVSALDGDERIEHV